MVEKNSALQEAEILYENGCYNDAATKCIEVIKTGECIKEAYLLWAKAYLFLIPMTMAEDQQYTKGFYEIILSISTALLSFCEIPPVVSSGPPCHGSGLPVSSDLGPPLPLMKEPALVPTVICACARTHTLFFNFFLLLTLNTDFYLSCNPHLCT